MVTRRRYGEADAEVEAARFVRHVSSRGPLRFELEQEATLPRAEQRALGEVSRFWIQFNAPNALHGSLAVRFLSAVNGLLERMDDQALRDAGAGVGEFEALIVALTGTPGLPLDERDLAQLRGAGVNRELLAAEGGAVGSNEAADLLGISRQAVAKRVLRERLLAVTPTGGRQRFPRWQFADGGVLPGLEETLALLATGRIDPWARLLFFLSEQDDIAGPRPLDALRAGDVAGVVRAAARYAAVPLPPVAR